MKHRSRSWMGTGLVVAALAAAPMVMAQDRPAVVRVDEVRVEPLVQSVPVLGRLVARQSGPVAALVGGVVAEVLVDVGDRVERGDVLARLDDQRNRLEYELSRAEYDLATAQRASAEARVDLLEQEHARLEALRDSAAFSKARHEDKLKEIEAASAESAAASARATQYEARLALQRLALSRLSIRAAYQGVVTARHVSPAAYLDVGDAVVTIVDDSSLEIEADVPADLLSGLVPGTRVSASLDNGGTYEATLRAVVPEENPLTRTRAVRFVLEGTALEDAATGQSVTIGVPVGTPRDVVTVHKDAVLVQQGQRTVYIVADDTASPRPVELGAAVDGRFEVKSGLEVGDLVVIRGNERLRPGQSVRVDGGRQEGDSGAPRRTPS